MQSPFKPFGGAAVALPQAAPASPTQRPGGELPPTGGLFR